MKSLFLIVLIVCFRVNAYANEFWKNNYAKVDSVALTIKETSDIKELAFLLTHQYTNVADKYRSIFAWVAHNIAYDIKALKYPALRETDPAKVIRNGKAVCAGYSTLFAKLCELTNLECKTISGWSKEEPNIGRFLPAQPNHAWNAIKIEGNWYLCDVTWGAGSVSQSTKGFKFNFKDQYFCTPPNLFALNHYPEDKAWILGDKRSVKSFSNLPHFYPEAINLNLNKVYPAKGIIKYKRDKEVKFRFVVGNAFSSISIVPSNAKYATQASFSLENGVVEIKYKITNYSPYLYIYIDDKAFLAYKILK